MTWTAKINDWEEWTSQRLADSKTLPDPRYWIRDVPWWEDFLNLLGEDGPPQDLHDSLEAAVRRGDGVAARLVGLDLYYRLAHQDSDSLKDEFLADARRLAAKEYRGLVTAVPSDEVPADRRRIDWELRLCSPLRMWRRADAMLEKLEGCLNLQEVDSIRAQHLFQRRYFVSQGDEVHDSGIDKFTWISQRVSGDQSVEFELLSVAALIFSGAVSLPDVPPPEEVYAAVERGNWPEVPRLKPLLLARPAFELGLYREVIQDLNLVLEASSRRDRPEIYGALWNASQRHGDVLGSKTLLDRWNFEFPGDHGVLMKLASACADTADYENAYLYLQRAVTQKPELEEDLATRVGLALGPIATDRARTWSDLEAAIAQHPALERVMETVVQAYWATFAELNTQERVAWITAMYGVHVLAEETKGLAPAWLRQAGVTFLTVAEVQLRHRIFWPMRTEAAQDPELLRVARSIRSQQGQDQILARFLGSAKGVITLGQMVHILERAQSQAAAGPFGDLLSKHLSPSPVLAELEAVQRLERPRNDAVHELNTLNARAMHDDARRVIDAVARHAKGGARDGAVIAP